MPALARHARARPLDPHPSGRRARRPTGTSNAAELERQGIRSVVAVPLMNAGRLRGFVGLDSVVRDRTWDDDTIRMLRTVVGHPRVAARALRGAARRSGPRGALPRPRPALVRHDRAARPGRPADVHRRSQRAARVHPRRRRRACTRWTSSIPTTSALATRDARASSSTARITPDRSRCGCATTTASGSRSRSRPATCSTTRPSAASSSGFRDIRERLRAESELRESEARLRTLVRNIPGAVYRCEATPPYADEFVSEAVYALTGYTAEEFLARRRALRRADPARATASAATASSKTR